MKTPDFWARRGVVSTLLLPISWLYFFVTYVKRYVVFTTRLDIPVICIGNLTAGGAGKTPVALALGEKLKAKGKRAFFLSRGYGGYLRGPILVDPAKHCSAEVGDEPLLLARILPTIIAKNRAEGARFACLQGAEIIVMDDGLQNTSLAKTLSFLVVDGRYGFGNGRLIPSGPLREIPDCAASHVDAIIIVEPSSVFTLPTALKRNPVFRANIVTDTESKNLAGKRVIAFCGLARPEKFFATIAALGAELIDSRSYADHHAYSDKELQELKQYAKQSQAILVTTQKDAVRLSASALEDIIVIKITLTFEHAGALDTILSDL